MSFINSFNNTVEVDDEIAVRVNDLINSREQFGDLSTQNVMETSANTRARMHSVTETHAYDADTSNAHSIRAYKPDEAGPSSEYLPIGRHAETEERVRSHVIASKNACMPEWNSQKCAYAGNSAAYFGNTSGIGSNYKGNPARISTGASPRSLSRNVFMNSNACNAPPKINEHKQLRNGDCVYTSEFICQWENNLRKRQERELSAKKKGTTFYNSAVSMSQAKPWNSSTSTINETLCWRTPVNKPDHKCRSNIVHKVNKNIVIFNKKISTQPEILDFFTNIGNDSTGSVGPSGRTPNAVTPHVHTNVQETEAKQAADISRLCNAINMGSMASGNDERPCSDGIVNSIGGRTPTELSSTVCSNDTVGHSDPPPTHAITALVASDPDGTTDQVEDIHRERPVTNSHPNSVSKGNTIFEYRVLDLLDDNLLADKPKQLDAKHLGTINYLKVLKIGKKL